ncbi:MAG TPA: helix-hairpin-helix domain-containing protein [Tenuifilaceae bacterium]|nr:helix-hairpin-helix domain-containing protein [Tenuifilaceae bacterium]HPI45963.1 helix-hairpin-helix domain-containing protein [Tenuifilaceae bacterium]HPN23102.1 helix-hairpin-helix domain-containing protein [Tenuifilaceae bacterium]
MKNRILKGRIKHFLTYSKSEKNGTIVLSVILLILIIASFVYRPISSSNFVDKETYEKIDSFFTSVQYSEPDDELNSKRNVLFEELPISKEFKSFYFNPNTISIDSLVDLGLSPKQAQVVINYRNKGGRFKTPDDLSKIHVIDSFTFKRLRPWVQITSINQTDSSRAQTPTEQVIVEINSADSVALTKIRGIGRSFARRIVLYRNSLGGFYCTNQLLEVYGLNPEVVKSIQENIYIDSSLIRKLNLNLISYEELKGHPYITDYQAKSIIYYRSKRGSIGNVAELLDNKLLPKDRYEKIKPYFTVK